MVDFTESLAMKPMVALLMEISKTNTMRSLELIAAESSNSFQVQLQLPA